jgi:AraC-like DNA-binding protein
MPRRTSPIPAITRARLEFWRDLEMPMIEGRRTTGSCACYRAHTHPTLSVGIVDAGQSTLRLGRHAHRLRAGDVVVIAPGQVHACNPLPDRSWSYRMFYLDAVWARHCAGPGAPEQAWSQGVVRHPAAGQLVGRIERALRGSGPAEKRRAVIGRCLRALFALCPEIHRSPNAPSQTANLRAIRDYLEAHCFERVPLSHLAGMAGLSSFRLIRLFRREFGLTPHAYQLDGRINRTRALLRRGHSLADLACLAGFTDQSHFQRAFKLRVAATPVQYRSAPPLRPPRSR